MGINTFYMPKTFVIGNGPSALSRKLGKRIDAADVVIRLNDFRLQGFEDFVGQRTSVLFTCRLNEYLETLHQFPRVVLCLLMNPLDGVEIPDELLKSPNIMDRIDWPQVEKLLPTLGLRENCYPSTGFLAVLYALQKYGRVHLVGFDGLGGGNRHYYEDGNRANPIRHDGDREREWLNLFERLGLVTDLSRQTNRDFYKFDGHDPFIENFSIT
jgi:hypothetical protein